MADNKTYKRSWKNYLLDKNYQLRFTLTMMVIAAGLMAPLGWWVSQKSTTATEVALNKIDEVDCPDVLVLKEEAAPPAAAAPALDKDGAEETDLLEEGLTEPEESIEQEADPAELEAAAALDGAEAGTEEDDSAGDDGERERPRIKVTIDDSKMPDIEPVVVVGEMKSAPPTAEEIEASKKARAACQAEVVARKTSVSDRKSLISKVMISSAVFLLLLLGVYGIKTTHRVAGPLHKVKLYLGKLENNVYDTVYNLRKGDQLMEFYEHFKGAHEGLTKLQREDRDRLKDAIALAKDAGLVEKNKEFATLIVELERLLAEKEESLVNKQA